MCCPKIGVIVHSLDDRKGMESIVTEKLEKLGVEANIRWVIVGVDSCCGNVNEAISCLKGLGCTAIIRGYDDRADVGGIEQFHHRVLILPVRLMSGSSHGELAHGKDYDDQTKISIRYAVLSAITGSGASLPKETRSVIASHLLKVLATCAIGGQNEPYWI